MSFGCHCMCYAANMPDSFAKDLEATGAIVSVSTHVCMSARTRAHVTLHVTVQPSSAVIPIS